MGARASLIAVCCVLAGCASTGDYASYKAPDAACVKGDMANFFKFFIDGEAHVNIKEIDGRVTDGGTGPYCFPPGRHRLGLLGHNDYQTAQDYVDLDFEAGRKYWIRGNRRGISIVFQMFDVTSEPEVKVAEFKLKVNSVTSQPIPIFIPVR